MSATDDDLALRVVDLHRHFRRERGDLVAAVDGVSLGIERGTMVTLLGPSGCGKTTFLRCIAGLETPTGGEIWSGGRLLSSGERGVLIRPERRGFGMMFQSYAVWPHLSVFENVAYPLKLRRWRKAKIKEQVSRILGVVGIEHLRNEYATRLSGGQQQRVALARCLVYDPEVILFDEPLSNVDAKVREELRVELLAMQRRLGFAGVYVTHDQEEAMAISDRVVVMNHGKAAQVGTPRDIYHNPDSHFVASFIGVVNLWKGVLGSLSPDGETWTASTEIGELVIAADSVPGEHATTGTEVGVMIRPEGATVVADRPEDVGTASVLKGTLRAEMFRGAHTDHLIEVGDQVLRARAGDETELEVGQPVFVLLSSRGIRVLPPSDDTPPGQAQ